MHISGVNQNLCGCQWFAFFALHAYRSELCNSKLTFHVVKNESIVFYLSLVALFPNDRILNLLVSHVVICEGIHIVVQ
jgi:hypothetical protein